MNNHSSATSDLFLRQITVRRESAPSLARDLQVSFAVPVSFIGCLFCLCFEVWICNSDDEEHLKDLSRSRNWEDFYLFFPWWDLAVRVGCLVGSSLLMSNCAGWVEVRCLFCRSPDWMIACDSDENK